MNKRIYYIILIFTCQFFQVNLYSQGTWESLESPTNQFLTSVYFVDSLYGWAVGDSGTIIHSYDGGNNWVFQNSKTENKIVDVFFLNRELGWASSWNTSSIPFGTIILKTTDGGQSWRSELYQDENIFMTTILFLDSLNGWMGGKPHALVKTTNGGLSWAQADIDTSIFAFFPISRIKFYNDQYGYACGGSVENVGLIWRTNNGGNKWFVIEPTFAASEPILEVHIFDTLNIIGIGGDFEFLGVGTIRTTDSGLTWEYEYIGIPGSGVTMDFRNDNEAWASLGGRQKFIYSSDSGATWIQIPTPDSSSIFDVIFPDSLHGFAVGMEGAILKYKPPIVDAVSSYPGVSPISFRLFQNYPNPFNPKTILRFSIPQIKYVELKIYDILGNEIVTLVNEEKPPGEYEIEFSAKGGSAFGGSAWNLTSGIYFYQLKAEGYVETRKMLLLK
jgi:photosystem II stability/assembly factor-like uncharacterized protein